MLEERMYLIFLLSIPKNIMKLLPYEEAVKDVLPKKCRCFRLLHHHMHIFKNIQDTKW